MNHNVLVDFSHLADFNGFGEIARNYAPLLAQADLPDIHFIYIVPDHLVGLLGLPYQLHPSELQAR